MDQDRDETDRRDAPRHPGAIDTLTAERIDRIRWIARRHYQVTDAWFIPAKGGQWHDIRGPNTTLKLADAQVFCHRTLRHDALLVIEDARRHPDFASHPQVAGPPHLRFYAGVPVRDPAGLGIGTLCLIDMAPVASSALDLGMLQVLATQVEEELGKRPSPQPALKPSRDHIDTLTGLPNRRLLQMLMEAELAVARQRNHSLSVCLINLDGFKCINESHGSAIGDEVLQVMAGRLRDAVRRQDLVTHLGGDEFAIILRDRLQPEACNRILDRLRIPIRTSTHVLTLTASMGVTCYPDDDEDPDALLHHAYQAMYSAKEAGKNGYCRFDLEHHHFRRQRLALARDVHLALSRQQLELFYQPKIDYHGDTVAAFEGLLRWRLPSGDILPPGAFLPAIENSWLDIEVGKYVIDTALRDLDRILQRGLPYSISVNVNPSSLLDSGFIDHLHHALALHDRDLAGRLTLEILESTSPPEELDTIVSNLQACLRLGLQLSLDDFGTGQSSLSYLRTFPTQKIKIDRSFVIGMLDNPEDEAIVAAIIGLSKSFKRRVVAEGVENGAIEARLKGLGCDLGQGFYYSPALPFEQAMTWAGDYARRRH
ncbi:sensor domain-containing phosphodiesterase [Salinicola sp. CR57]|uniref:sensor domain-containing phosphodiesterase n=1 Tax=Salinicola sp. CR57 TaxID=1949086 RepID=UPI001E5B891C|nr:sensor domain-containing phosphodiesterase [Salinicola sp. CR57]